MLVDRQSIPLAAIASAANGHDSRLLEEVVDSVEPVKGPRGRSRKRPDKLHADKGYDYPRCRRSLLKRGIKARIARRGVESNEKLGRHRWVVERTRSLGSAVSDVSRSATSVGQTFTKLFPTWLAL